jgi:hypothetical protein
LRLITLIFNVVERNSALLGSTCWDVARVNHNTRHCGRNVAASGQDSPQLGSLIHRCAAATAPRASFGNRKNMLQRSCAFVLRFLKEALF